MQMHGDDILISYQVVLFLSSLSVAYDNFLDTIILSRSLLSMEEV